MLFEMISRRLWRERGAMSVLFGALVLVCAFMSLGTLYVRAVAESEFALRLENLRPDDFRLEVRNPQPITEDTGAIFDDLFGADARAQTTIKASSEGTLSESPQDTFQIIPYAYRDFDDLFTLVDGRLPELSPDTETVEVVVTDIAAEVFEQYMSAITGEPVEAIGFVLWTSSIQLEIVGIVEAAYPPGHPYWNPLREYIFGEIAPGGNLDTIFLSPIVPEAIFVEEIAPHITARFSWFFDLNPDLITVANLNALDGQIRGLEERLLTVHPNVTVNTPLRRIIADFNASIRQTEIPVLFLSTAVLILLLYNLLTINTLILDGQKTEWAIIASRGGSAFQLMAIHAGVMAILGIVAALLAPFVALVLLAILSVIGPQSAIIDAPRLSDISANAFALSAVVALVAVIVLTASGWPSARAGLLALKGSVSRPPTRAMWLRFGLDFILLALGAGFIIRLYFLVAGDDASLVSLFTDPSTFVQTLAGEGTESLSDPFNIAGPILLLAGLTLLWMRFFPYLIRGMGLLVSRINNFTLRLAFWNVEREPAHYAQIVLLLIGTLAMGTASLALAHTRDSGAWQTAYDQTGADAVVWLDDDSPAIAWDALPDVVEYTALTQSTWGAFAPGADLTLFGLPPDDFAAVDADSGLLEDYSPLSIDGISLPSGVVRIQLDAYVETVTNDDVEVTHGINALFRTATGAPLDVPMTTPNSTVLREWVTFTADLSRYDAETLILTGFTFQGIGDIAGRRMLDLTMTLDNLRGVAADGDSVLLDDFDMPGFWERTPQSGVTGGTILTVDLTNERATEGETALRVLMQLGATRRNLPGIRQAAAPPPPIPVVISAQFADLIRGRSRLERPVAIGDELNVDFTRVRGDEGLTNRLRFDYVVAGIAPDFPSMAEGSLFIIARERDLLITLNREVNRSGAVIASYTTNRVQLTLAGDEPSPALRAALNNFAVDYAWTRFSAIQREPLPNAITGMLFAGFWVSLGLILVDFALYLAMTTKRRAASFAVLGAMGWERGRVWGLLSAEQITFITPALIVGVLLGVMIAYLVLPFMALIGAVALRVPLIQVAGLLAVLIVAFSILLIVTALNLRRVNPTEAFRHAN